MAHSYRCPLCGSSLPRDKFERVTHIQAERERLLQQARTRETELRTKVQQAQKQARDARKDGLLAGRDAEKRRSERLVQGVQKKLTLANERIRQLEKGSTPQTEGLEFQDKLHVRLVREFPQDDIVLEGKGGDILQTVILNGKPAGLILFECKQELRIKQAHIDQAARDKNTRQADFALLVTVGTRMGFTGLGKDGAVLIVAPLAVIALVGLVRDQIIHMARAKLTRSQRERVATAVLDYVTSPTFRVPLEGAIDKTRRAQTLLLKEYVDHMRVWHDRWDLYQTIDLSLSHISGNVSRLVGGSKPVPLEKPKLQPLLLPPVASGRR